MPGRTFTLARPDVARLDAQTAQAMAAFHLSADAALSAVEGYGIRPLGGVTKPITAEHSGVWGELALCDTMHRLVFVTLPVVAPQDVGRVYGVARLGANPGHGVTVRTASPDILIDGAATAGILPADPRQSALFVALTTLLWTRIG